MPAESSVNLRADLRQLSKDLQAAGGMEQGKAEAMVIALEKRLKKAEAAAKASTKAQQDAAKASGDWNKKLAGLQQVASQLPGPLAQIATMSLNAGKGLGALGAAGAGLTAGVAVVGALALGTKMLADSALEAEARLNAAGQAALVSEEARASLREYDDSSKALRTSIDALTVSLGGSLAPAITTVNEEVTDTLDQWRTWGGVAQWLFDIITASPVAIVAEQQRDATRELANEQRRAFEDQQAQYNALGLLAEDAAVDAAHRADMARKHAEEERRAAEATRLHETAVRASHTAQVAYNASIRDAAALFDQLAREQNRAQHEQFVVDEAMRKGAVDAAAFAVECDRATAALQAFELPPFFTEQAIAASLERLTELVPSVVDSMTSAFNAITTNRIASLQREAAAERNAADRRTEAWAESEEARVLRMLKTGQLSRRQYESELHQIEETKQHRLRASRQVAKDEAERAKRLWKQQQAAAAAMVGIHAADGVLKSIATLGPPIPPNFVGIAGVAAVGAAAITEGANIASARPPEFPMGRVPSATSTSGSPDHRQVVAVRDDEPIVNPRGRQRLGDATIAAANDGQALGPTIVNLHVDGRLLATAVVDQLGDGWFSPTPGSWSAGRRGLYGGR